MDPFIALLAVSKNENLNYSLNDRIECYHYQVIYPSAYYPPPALSHVSTNVPNLGSTNCDIFQSFNKHPASAKIMKNVHSVTTSGRGDPWGGKDGELAASQCFILAQGSAIIRCPQGDHDISEEMIYPTGDYHLWIFNGTNVVAVESA